MKGLAAYPVHQKALEGLFIWAVTWVGTSDKYHIYICYFIKIHKNYERYPIYNCVFIHTHNIDVDALPCL